ncbi:hypothetical protein BDV96DRAFT_655418 [Lophiotrema nucula]|uniref:Uncharacterized protein n=1 Tax=Lophiotrema nucula TaxID=690887 RepID=A0A6A5YEU5_9PLEO|nr:hypothetical protein BDV96DRAFT_655418 [Lophiotrema nucula]
MVRPDYLTLLTGAWQWLNGTSFYPNGTKYEGHPDFAMGLDATGILHYTKGLPDDALWVSTILHPLNNLTSLRPPNIIYDAEDSGSLAEWALIGQHNLAYGAPFNMEVFQKGDPSVTTGDQGRLVHGPIKFSNVPSFAGVSLERNFTFLDDDNLLRLRTWDAKNGVIGYLNWRRMT